MIVDTLNINFDSNSYDVIVGNDILSECLDKINLNRKVMIVTSTTQLSPVARSIMNKCKKAFIYYIEPGENYKTINTWCDITGMMVHNNFDRYDCIIALGGGVVSDVAGFVASTYMRGIDFYNIPTTLLAQVDASIGGKTGVNFMGCKNIVGSFYQPKLVIVDTKLLETLSDRHFKCGVVEAIKMAVTFDAEFFDKLSGNKFKDDLENNIIKCLSLKKQIVERDEKEENKRKLLNFGHTLGHAIESYFYGDLYHGECVATGMLPMCSSDVRNKIINVLELNDIHTINLARDDIWEGIIDNIKHDKKLHGDNITIAYVNNIGEGYLQTLPIFLLHNLLNVWRKETYS